MKGSFSVGILFSMLLFFSCQEKDKAKADHSEKTKYTCSMHPQIIRDEPGTCPICSMDLVPIHSTAEHSAANDSLISLVKPTNELVLSDIKTIRPETSSKFEYLNVKGVINYNTNNFNSLSSRVSGRIERLYVRYNYQPVSKGQKLMDIYSPDLANAQQELLFLKNNNEPVLLESAKKKLRLLGATEQQINQVLITGKVDYRVTVYSPYSGYVSESKNTGSSGDAAVSAGSTMISGGSSGASMGGDAGTSPSTIPAPPNVGTNSSLLLREGQYITAGQKMFDLVNSNSVFAEFYIHPDQLDKFKKGTMMQVNSIDSKSKKVRVPVSLVQPYYSEGVNYSLVKATIPNPNKSWKVGELIHVNNENTRKIGTWVPRSAVVQLGTRYVSFLKEKESFVPVYVSVKNISGDWIDIGNSLSTTQELAVNAWFLVDSESFIQVQNPQPQ